MIGRAEIREVPKRYGLRAIGGNQCRHDTAGAARISKLELTRRSRVECDRQGGNFPDDGLALRAFVPAFDLISFRRDIEDRIALRPLKLPFDAELISVEINHCVKLRPVVGLKSQSSYRGGVIRRHLDGKLSFGFIETDCFLHCGTGRGRLESVIAPILGKLHRLQRPFVRMR